MHITIQSGVGPLFCYTPEANVRARQAFEQAILLGPRVASAYVGMGWTYWLEWTWLWNYDARLLDQAQAFAHKAIDLQCALPQAYALLAATYLMKQQHDLALTAATRAVDLDRFDVGAAIMLAEVLICMGKPYQALMVVENVNAFDPTAAVYSATVGHAYRVLGRYEEAITAFRDALTYNPKAVAARTQLALVYSQAGQPEKAWAEMQTGLRRSPSVSVHEMARRLPYADPAQSQHVFFALENVGIQ